MRLIFRFDEPEEKNLQTVNQVLSGLKVAELSLENLEGGVTTQRQYQDDQVISLRRWYSVLGLTLEVQPDDNGCIYQMDAMVVPACGGDEHEHCADIWRAGHPERVMRIAQSSVGAEAEMASFVVLHHAKE